MNMNELAQAERNYRALCEAVPLKTLRTRRDYDRAVRVLNEMLDAGGADQKHPLAELVATLGLLIEAYESKSDPTPDIAPREVLRLLMDQHGLRQSQLPEVGTQGVVSEVLSGKRELNVRQIRALAKRFHVHPRAFF